MFYFIKTKLIDRLTKRNIFSIYNLDIDSGTKSITISDLSLIRFFLKFTPPKDHLFCRIRKWSDDVFVNISCKSNKKNWDSCTKNLYTVSEIVNDNNEGYVRDFLCLIVDEDFYDNNNGFTDILNHTVDFINSRKKEYQRICSIDSAIYFEQDCTVNSFKVVWGQEDYINYILYDIG
ncbi:hypothetical protein [Candidatus Enterococcus clewellii]|uniref:Uncharacterized protein n=1 Tax=Candidatus Enterococcus clewellii TaxID=1834193 RepID=A0AAQ3VYL4_9ENTE